MRTTIPFSLLYVAVLAACAGCVKDVNAPALSGPSTFATSIVMTALQSTLPQDGVATTGIRIVVTDAQGRPKNDQKLKASISVDGIVQDFGRLSTKEPVPNVEPYSMTYTAPPPSALAAGRVAQTVTISVTPVESDFRSEFSREIDIRLVPQGVILPINPNLSADFSFLPASPKVLDVITFDASASTNNGSACNSACSYSWTFGDGTTGAGLSPTHIYRAVDSYQVTLTVTDARGAQTVRTKTVAVAPGAPPTAVDFTMSPANPGTNQTIFFNASASRAATGRTLVSYDWDFGKGTTGTGVTVSKSYAEPGTYTITLKVTDDAGAFASTTKSLTVGSDASKPTARLTFSPSAPKANTTVFFDASASTPASSNIVEYRFTWGDNSTDTVGTSATATHQFSVVGGASTTYVVRVTVTDSEGRQGTTTVNVPVAP